MASTKPKSKPKKATTAKPKAAAAKATRFAPTKTHERALSAFIEASLALEASLPKNVPIDTFYTTPLGGGDPDDPLAFRRQCREAYNESIEALRNVKDQKKKAAMIAAATARYLKCLSRPPPLAPEPV